MTEQEPEPDDYSVRLCVRVTDNPFLPLKSDVEGTPVIRKCDNCDHEVWVDAAQPLPAYLPQAVKLLCIDCAIENPVVGPTVLENLKAAYVAKRAGRVHSWRIS